ncbi:flagellar protein export ATPase FliI [Pueribacillus sp. YX66]|uniref:flagellar protein export ATPase FliI n=1 Tax=Pueribacillus sp. YX66 TaxID=3229242 RepID=UPI00358D0970
MNEQLLYDAIKQTNPYKRYGKVTKVVGLMIESKGPETSIGNVCILHIGKRENRYVMAEVVGFKEEFVLLMPFTNVSYISPGCLVEDTGKPLHIQIGPELIGTVLDGIGLPLDGYELPKGLISYPTDNPPPNPLKRRRIEKPIEIGVRAIDGLLSVGEGQRLGIFAGSGVGKSTLLGMIARNSSADINVIALIGERGREVLEFVEKDLGEDGLKRSIVIAATSDQPALMRIKGALTATAIAEYFRNQGKNVMLMMDSVTRVAMAQREIGLAIGEPPTTKGYTPSVFSLLPKMLERSGTNEVGSITAFYTVLVDGDDFNEPIADTVRGILDGHFVLDRDLANKGQFPAINILESISRVMNHIVSPEHLQSAQQFRDLLATYLDAEDLIKIGAYKTGTSKKIDEAIAAYDEILAYLKQNVGEQADFEHSIEWLTTQFNKGE